VLVDEVAVDALGPDDVVGDVVEDRQVALRLERQRQVGQLVRAVLEGRQHRHLGGRRAQAPVGDARPQDGVHLRHVRAPQHERVGVFDIVVTAHRLVGAEGAHETHRGRGHAVARVGVEVVGAKARLHQLERGVAFPHGPLARAEHPDRFRPLVLEHPLELLGHHVEGLVPGHGRELAVLGVLAVLHAQQRLRQAIAAVHDLGQEITLDAVQALVDLGVEVAVRGHHLVVLDGHVHAAAGAAESTGRLGPLELGGLGLGHDVLGIPRQRHPGHGGGGRGGGLLDEIPTSH